MSTRYLIELLRWWNMPPKLYEFPSNIRHHGVSSIYPTPLFTKSIGASPVCSHWRVLVQLNIMLGEILESGQITTSPSSNCKTFAFLHLKWNVVYNQHSFPLVRQLVQIHFFLIKSHSSLLWRTCRVINNIMSTFHPFTVHLTLSIEPLKTLRCTTTPTHFTDCLNIEVSWYTSTLNKGEG